MVSGCRRFLVRAVHYPLAKNRALAPARRMKLHFPPLRLKLWHPPHRLRPNHPLNLDARANEILEEVEIYKTYGRADQAIELLVEAVNDGVAPPALVLRLVECYIESDRMPEAKILIDSLELSEEDDLVGRANQMMFDAPQPAFRGVQTQGIKTPPKINGLMRTVQCWVNFLFQTILSLRRRLRFTDAGAARE